MILNQPVKETPVGGDWFGLWLVGAWSCSVWVAIDRAFGGQDPPPYDHELVEELAKLAMMDDTETAF